MIRPIILIALLASPASAHEWYPTRCCNERDCYSIGPADYELTATGYRILATNEVIAYGAEKPSPDGAFHRCSWAGNPLNDTIGIGTSNGPCFWAPMMGASN